MLVELRHDMLYSLCIRSYDLGETERSNFILHLKYIYFKVTTKMAGYSKTC